MVHPQYVRGLKDRAARKPRFFGRHNMSMRSTLEICRTEYYRGYDEMAAYLRSEQGKGLQLLRQDVLDDYREECQADCNRTGRF